jgi:cell division protease FtsH
MSYAEETPALRPTMSQQASSLANEWRKLTRAATAVAILTAPAFFLVLHRTYGWSVPVSLLVTFLAVVAFRGLVDVLAHKLIPHPNLYGASPELLEADVVARRRTWYWRTRFRHLTWFLLTLLGLLVIAWVVLRLAGQQVTLFGSLPLLGKLFLLLLPQILPLLVLFPLFFLFNALILFGPLAIMGIMQMKAFEPGDADWGVKLADVRGQAEPKEEVTRVISLWQSGEAFKKAGGKPERGLLFLGAPGTGKTMLSKAIATSFNSPIMLMPGSGFAQTFIGIDVLVVLLLVARARRLARKWGGQCIVFIDEIDAVGMRRQALNPGLGFEPRPSLDDVNFYGPWGSITASGDVIIESRAWRERLFASRARTPAGVEPPAVAKLGARLANFMFPGGMGFGGGMALNQLLVQMDGVDNPPFMKRFMTKRINTLLDAMYVIPRRVGSVSLRLRPVEPRPEQIYFIGATNVPIDALDPALIRPGRMGRHIWFRTPTKDDRKDIFDLYINKVAHGPELDTEPRRDELARMTSGYSPAMIEQVCSMALTYAHSEGRMQFNRADIVEAMTTVETGTAQGVEYVPEETRAVALHEAGHAVGSYLFQDNIEATRLTIRKRGEALGHFQSAEKEERFSSWRSEEMALLVMILSAMATEHVIYGENGRGVGGDLQGASFRAMAMVGVAGMAPEYVDVSSRFASEEEEEEARERIMQRFERIGNQIIHRSDAGAGSPYAQALVGVLDDRYKRALAAQIMGQAYVTAYNAMRHNRQGLERIADVLVERRELHGDDVIELLEDVAPRRPNIDLLDRDSWPRM